MMRSFENRGDSIVVDEPLYAHYLNITQRDHPGRDEVIASGPTDLKEAVAGLFAPLPVGKSVFYQKHMAHHVLPGMDLSWAKKLTNAFLIRDPREVITSFIKHVPDVGLLDTGFKQQAELFAQVKTWTGKIPPVVDARDVLTNPRGVLSKLCEAVEIPFTEKMLVWPAGKRDSDGIWAKYWYKEVEATTGFGSYKPKPDQVPAHLNEMLEQCQGYYAELYEHRIKPD